LVLHFPNQFLIYIASDSKPIIILNRLHLLTRRVMRIVGRQCSENANPNNQTKVTFRNRTKSSPIANQRPEATRPHQNQDYSINSHL